MCIRAKNRTQFTKQLPSMQIALFRQYNHEMSPLRECLTRVNKKFLCLLFAKMSKMWVIFTHSPSKGDKKDFPIEQT